MTLVAYVGSYTSPDNPDAGGITVLEVSADGAKLTPVGHAPQPREAGYAVHADGVLYAVDERKTAGRGGVPAGVHALAVASDGALTWVNSRPAPGPFPTHLAVNAARGVLVSANHGDFGHVEKIVRTDAGWDVEYVFDDSAVLLYNLEPGGGIGTLRDVAVMTGHSLDPNSSPQAGGHAQATGHAHCAVFDPTGEYLLVADKGTDQVHTYRIDDGVDAGLRLVATADFPAETGPRHIAFDPATRLGFLTCEFASDLASFALGADGDLRILDRVSTSSDGYTGPNEPADVRVGPDAVYVNNRGEDTVAWFSVDADGRLAREGDVPLAASLHPGVAARSLAFDPAGSFLLVADRPSDLVRSYRVSPGSGALTPLSDVHVAQPAFVTVVDLERLP